LPAFEALAQPRVAYVVRSSWVIPGFRFLILFAP
jgi:hypothetical protein